MALCQFLPGPASSQVGIAIGLLRAGYVAIAAWIGFTLPSALALVLFAYGVDALSGTLGSGWLHGIKVVAMAVVAQAMFGMMRALAPDRERATLAVAAAAIVLAVTHAPKFMWDEKKVGYKSITASRVDDPHQRERKITAPS